MLQIHSKRFISEVQDWSIWRHDLKKEVRTYLKTVMNIDRKNFVIMTIQLVILSYQRQKRIWTCLVFCVIWHKVQGTVSLSHKASNILTETDDDIQRNHTRPKNSKWNVWITIQVSRSRNYMHKLLSPQIFSYKYSFTLLLKT